MTGSIQNDSAENEKCQWILEEVEQTHKAQVTRPTVNLIPTLYVQHHRMFFCDQICYHQSAKHEASQYFKEANENKSQGS